MHHQVEHHSATNVSVRQSSSVNYILASGSLRRLHNGPFNNNIIKDAIFLNQPFMCSYFITYLSFPEFSLLNVNYIGHESVICLFI